METLQVYKAIKQLSEFKWHMYMPYPYFFLSDEPQNQALSKGEGGTFFRSKLVIFYLQIK